MASEGTDPVATILVVDDNAENRALAEAVLTEEGHAVVLASGGEEGVALLDLAREGVGHPRGELVLVRSDGGHRGGCSESLSARERIRGGGVQVSEKDTNHAGPLPTESVGIPRRDGHFGVSLQTSAWSFGQRMRTWK